MKKTLSILTKSLLCATLILHFQFPVSASAQAQDTIFGYTHQGTMLYYMIDGNQQAVLVSPLHPNRHYNADSSAYSTWHGYAKPQGAVTVPDSVPFGGSNHAVTRIANRAFYQCDSMTALSLPRIKGTGTLIRFFDLQNALILYMTGFFINLQEIDAQLVYLPNLMWQPHTRKGSRPIPIIYGHSR